MPRRNDPEHYPEFFVEYVTKAGLRGETVRVPAAGSLPDDERTTGLEKALKIRGLFYAFVGSVKARRRAGDEKWTEIANYADQTVFYIDKKAGCIFFYPRSKSWQTQVLATGGVVEGERAEPVASPAAESLKRLQEQLKGDFE